jgi:predicted TPR repeat methyltransferase
MTYLKLFAVFELCKMMNQEKLGLRPVSKKMSYEIALEWDRLAHIRHEQILSGKDLSFDRILLPTILSLAASCDWSNTLDFGCGTGILSEKLAASAGQVVGVDMSTVSIEIAQRQYSNIKSLTFVASTIEEYAQSKKNSKFSLVVANMTLMDTLSLSDTLSAIARLLKPSGAFVFTITHPCFWSMYWNYANEEWFDYSKEIIIEAPFKISLEELSDNITTHVHRPLQLYINALHNAGFTIDNLVEPMPNQVLVSQYPKRWDYPRFLGMRCTQIK